MSHKEYSTRHYKVAENLKRVISHALNIDKVLDYVIGDVHVTVSEVRVASDIKSALVFIMPEGMEDRDLLIKLLNEYSFEVKKTLAKSTNLRYIPNLKFIYDELYDNASKIEGILNSIDQENVKDD